MRRPPLSLPASLSHSLLPAFCGIVLLLAAPGKTIGGHDTLTLTAQEIEKLQAHTMADILNTVPGLSAGSSSVSIHGNYKVKVFLDGRPLNDPTSSHGGIRWDLVSPEEITNILDHEYLYADGMPAPPRAWFAGVQVRI